MSPSSPQSLIAKALSLFITQVHRKHPAPPKLLSLLALVSALLVAPVQAQITLPYDTDFEAADGYTLGEAPALGPWSTSSFTVQITDADSASALWSVRFPAGSIIGWLSGHFTGGNPNGISYVDFYLKPAAGESQSLPAQAPGGSTVLTTFVESSPTQGRFHVVDGDGLGGGEWLSVPLAIPLEDGTAEDWVRLTYRLDYAAKTWDFYLDDTLVAYDLGFIEHSPMVFSRIRVRGGGLAPALFDFFYAGLQNPIFADSSEDGLPDAWKIAHGLNTNTYDRYGDPDDDDLPNILEYLLGTDPTNPDTDGDGMHDGWEYLLGTDPTNPDTDGDGMSDLAEVLLGFDPLVADTFTPALPTGDGVYEWGSGFETHEGYQIGTLDGQQGWEGQGATVTDSDAADGLQSLALTGEGTYARQYFGWEGHPEVWVSFRAWLRTRRFSFSTLPAPETLDQPIAAAFMLDGQRRLSAWDAATGGWLTWEQPLPDDWQDYTIHLDYNQKTWSLILNGGIIFRDLTFTDTQLPHFARFQARKINEPGDETAYIDSLLIATEEPAGFDFDGDGLDNATERALGTDPYNPDTDGDGMSDMAEVLLGLDPLVADTFAPALPTGDGVYEWGSGFETHEDYQIGTLDGQQGWEGQGATVTDSDAADGLQSLALTVEGAYARQYFGWDGHSEVWVSFSARLSAGTLPEPETLDRPIAAAFMLDPERRLSAWDAATGGWLISEQTPPDDWQDYTIHLDYSQKTWSLTLNGCLIFHDLTFTDTQLPHFARFQARNLNESGDKTAYIDSLLIASEEVLFTNHGVAAPSGQAAWNGVRTVQDDYGNPLILLKLWAGTGSDRIKNLLLINPYTGETETYEPSHNQGTGAYNIWVSDGNCFYNVIGSTFMEFDITQREWTFSAPIGPGVANGFTETSDGKIYLAMTPSAEILSFDPQTRQLTSHGYLGNEAWAQYPYLACDSQGWVYAGISFTQGNIVGFNPQTEEIRPLLTEAQRDAIGYVSSVDIYRSSDGKVYCALIDGSEREWFQLFAGAATPVAAPGGTRSSWSNGNTSPTLFSNGLRLDSISVGNRHAVILDPSTSETWDINFTYDSPGVRIYSIAVGDDDVLYGSTGIPLRFFRHIPEENLTEDWGLMDHGGHINVMVHQGGKIYGAVYSSGSLIEYDPGKPWDDRAITSSSNPLLLHGYGEAVQLYGRPYTMLAHSDGVHVLMGGIAARSTAGGGILIYNTLTGDEVVLNRNDLIEDHAPMSMAELPDGRIIVGTTTRAATGGVSPGGEAEVYILSWPQLQRVATWNPVPGATEIADLAVSPSGLVFGFSRYLSGSANTRLFVLDPDSGQVLHLIDLSAYGNPAAPQSSRMLHFASDGMLYILLRQHILQVDPITFSWKEMAYSTDRVFEVGFVERGGRLYFSSGSEIFSFRLPGVK